MGAQPVVVVDANTIVHGAWWLDSAAWTVLLYQSRVGAIRLVVPDLVLREAVGRFRAQVDEKVQAAHTAERNLGDIVRDGTPAREVDVEEVCGRYEEQLRRTIAAASADVPDIPAMDIPTLVDRAIARSKPFDDKGTGFRDALLWANVLDVLRDETGDVFLVSKDTTAFADGSALHPELVAEAEAAAGRAPTLLPSVAAVLDALGHAEPSLTAAALAALPAAEADLGEHVADVLLGFVVPARLPVTIRIVSVVIGGVQLVRVAAGGDADVTLAHLVAVVPITVDVFNDDATPSKIAHVFTTVEVQVTAVFTRADGTFSSVEVQTPELPDLPGVRREIVGALGPDAPLAYSQLLDAFKDLPKFEPPAALFEVLKDLPKYEPPPGLLDAFKNLPKYQPPPGLLDALKNLPTYGPAPGLLDALKHFPKVELPPGITELIQNASRYQLPPDVWKGLDLFRRNMTGFATWGAATASDDEGNGDDANEVADPPGPEDPGTEEDGSDDDGTAA